MANESLKRRHEDLYLDTINRKKLDFDFEKVCSVTLSNVNIYGCLTCGDYFQGRGHSSPAYYHSLDDDHHLFVNFNTLKVYILPEGQNLQDDSLNDIKYAIAPTYVPDQLRSLAHAQVKDLLGNQYKPGYIGLNNIKNNTYSNVVLHAICHCKLVRDWVLLSNSDSKDELNKRFTLFMRKLWSPKLFKNHISPHELLQHIGVISNKLYTINEPKDPKSFMVWLLNSLKKSFTTTTTDKSSIFTKAFQGKLQITTQGLRNDDGVQYTGDIKKSITKFWILTLELPPTSLFKDGFGIQQIPQIKLERLLEKYDGTTETIQSNEIRKFQIMKFPPYLILHFNRFKDLNLDLDLTVKDRNQTLVEFSLEISFGDVRYRLIANVVHEAIQSDNLDQDDKSDWKIQLRNGEEWFEIRDLEVETKEKELLFLGEAYIQVWERIK
jgi:U4/U6.U5 tri-snRNP-associated protein 2